MIKIKTSIAIAKGEEPALHIFHDMKNGDLVINGKELLNDDNTVIISIHDIISKDPSLTGIENLPEDWRAIRSSDQDDWDIGPFK